ncbi:MAG: DUF305 domain-containing protein [Mycobacteriaceae bacterium]|nr:DUF305 domain-containing protein [Mycobacteriaceae bacterium]
MFAALLALGLLTACGGSPERHAATSATSASQESSEAANHNAHDIAFARAMVTDEGQATQMAQMVPTNTTNPQVIALANQITGTEIPEVQAFRTWLMQWQDDPSGSSDEVPVAGMVEQATIDRLQSLTGAEFDRLWLTAMTAHQRGAIAVAQDEVAHGRNADVLYLARSIIGTQQAQIDAMKQLLGG